MVNRKSADTEEPFTNEVTKLKYNAFLQKSFSELVNYTSSTAIFREFHG